MKQSDSDAKFPVQKYLYGPEYPPEYYGRGDEISLVDMFRVVIQRKFVIIVTSIVCVALATLYASTQPVIYKTEVQLLPPSQSDIEALNTNGLIEFKREEIFSDVITAIASKQTQKKAFDNFIKLPPEVDAESTFIALSNSLTIHLPEQDDKTKKISYSEPVRVFIEGNSPEHISQFANAAIAQGISESLDDIERLLVEAKEKRIVQKINTLREKALSERLAEISRLEEADELRRASILEEINALRRQAIMAREAEIARIEEKDRTSKKEIENQIAALRASASKKRLDRIQELTEAAEIAKAAGVFERVSGTQLGQTGLKNAPAVYAEINTQPQKSPLYLMGEKALRAEIAVLKSRQSDDPFIPGLRALEDKLENLKYNEKLAALKKRTNDDPFISGLPALLDELKQLDVNEKVEGLKARKSDDPYIPEIVSLQTSLSQLNHFDIDNISPLTVDQKAVSPTHPIKPKAPVIITLGLVLGGMLGVFAAFFAHFVSKLRDTDNESALKENIPMPPSLEETKSKPRVVGA